MEFEHSFFELYRLSMEQTIKVPKRRRKWLSVEIDSCMNNVYRDIMAIADSYFKNKYDKRDFTSIAATHAIVGLNSLSKPLTVLWNVQGYEFAAMARWAAQIKKEVALLNKMHDVDDIQCDIFVLDWRVINNANFLKNMSELHRYTHGKIAGARMPYDDTQGSLLISLVNDAFYELLLANRKIPESKAEYEQRRQHISNAITYLSNMNRPMLFYFNLMQYSERVMNEWAELLTTELKLLTALQKSDKERFSSFS